MTNDIFGNQLLSCWQKQMNITLKLLHLQHPVCIFLQFSIVKGNHVLMKRFFSFMPLLILVMLIAGCGSTRKYTFYFAEERPDRNNRDNYVLMESGDRIDGDRIRWKSGWLVKDKVIIDGEKIPLRDVRAYQENGIYYIRHGVFFLPRVVVGKVSVYRHTVSEQYYNSGRNRWETRFKAVYYYQVGDGDELKQMRTLDVAKEVLANCPAAVAMLDYKDKGVKKELRRNRGYLNEVFEYYNSNCIP